MTDNIYDKNEAFVSLVSDDELRQTSEIGHAWQKMISDFLEKVRPNTMHELEELIEDVERSYNKSRKARIAGTSATVTGSLLAIIGFGLSFVTFGGSLGLTVAGSVLAAAGGVTLSGAEIGYLTVSQKRLKAAKTACHIDNEEMQKIETKGREFSNHLESLASKHPAYSREAIVELLKHIWKHSGKPTLKLFYNGYKLIDGASDVGRNAITVTTTFKAVQAGARTVYFGLGTVGRAVSIGSVALDVLFIPIDIMVLAKSAYDVHKYKNGKGESNSSAATDIRNIVKKLQLSREELIRVRDQLPGADVTEKKE